LELDWLQYQIKKNIKTLYLTYSNVHVDRPLRPHYISKIAGC